MIIISKYSNIIYIMSNSYQIQTLVNNIFTQFQSNEERFEEFKKKGYTIDVNDHHFNIFKYNGDANGPYCTGAVFDFQGKLAAYTFDKTINNVLQQNFGIEQFNNFISTNALTNENMYVYKYINGSRVYAWFDKINQTWRLSTSRTINAYNSDWNTVKKFGAMFEEILVSKNNTYTTDVFNTWAQQYLNTDFCYTFIIVHPEMKHSPSNVEYQIYLINVCNMNDLSVVPLWEFKTNVYTKNVMEFCNQNDETFIGNDMIKLQYYYNQICVGSINSVIIIDSQNRQFKLTNNTFQEVKESISKPLNDEESYLEIRSNEFRKNVYLSLFPERLQWTIELENTINGYVRKLFFEYVNYFMKKQKTQLEKPVHVFICQLHKIYLDTFQKITISKTFEHFNSLEFSDKLRLYKTCKTKYDGLVPTPSS